MRILFARTYTPVTGGAPATSRYSSAVRNSSMLALVAKHLQDVSVLRRLLFAASYLPREIPNFWGIAVEFATDGKVERNTVDVATATALVENIHMFDEKAFDTDKALIQQLSAWKPSMSQSGSFDKPLGIVLISPNTQCVLCGKALIVRKDRPASVVVYDDIFGSAPGTHYNKACVSKVCTMTQYYGYYTSGQATSQVFYNTDWKTLPYFVSSSLTAFSMDMLKRVDSEVLIGQLSYKQIADILYHIHLQKYENSE